MKWPTFQIKVLTDTEGRMVLSNSEAKEFLNLWDELFPEVVDLQDRTENRLRTTRTLVNLLGFPRVFYGRMSDELIREAISWVPQSTVGCITHNAVCDFQDYIEANNLDDWWLLNNKHDSYLAEVPDEQVDYCIPAMRAAIEVDLVSSRGEKFKMKSGVSVGKNWDKYSEENPLGMREL